jgi:hypothetical protein
MIPILQHYLMNSQTYCFITMDNDMNNIQEFYRKIGDKDDQFDIKFWQS